jgi:ABC-2 type transport system ATP-binding protein
VATLVRMATALALEAHGLAKSYGNVRAVDGFDTELPVGTVLGFLGPNGAGKTTVIRMLSTIVRPDSGSFRVAGAPHTDPREVRRRVGVLPESAGYPRAQTGEEWLTYRALLFGQSRAHARRTAHELLEQVGLHERARSMVATYSRGMRQRLGAAGALVGRPQLVLLDEPTLGLDPSGQQQLLELVSRIARERGAAVVLSTHQLDDVEQTCDQVLILNRGRIVAEGSVADVVRQAAAPREALVNVPLDRRDAAIEALNHANMRAVVLEGERGADLRLTMPSGVPAEEASGRALGVLLDADIPVLAFTFEGGRLSDAFLLLTEEVGKGDGR